MHFGVGNVIIYFNEFAIYITLIFDKCFCIVLNLRTDMFCIFPFVVERRLLCMF